jgi:branched-chain amino acid transport system ATP-binding protein
VNVQVTRPLEGPAHPVLSTHGLTVRFGGHVAVNAVSAEFHPGTLTAIVGPNGAGKTTYFNLVSGQLAATAGTVRLFGEDVTRLSAPQRAQRGIGRAFQLTQLFPNLTVLENVRLAVQSRARVGLHLLSLWSRRTDLIDRAMLYLEQVALAGKRDQPAAALAHGEQRKLEVAILLALEPQVLMFDEPTAGMGMDEVPAILDLIQRIKDRRDRTVLLVEHKLDVVRSLADRILVLQDGLLVADGDPAAVMSSAIVRQAYLGTEDDHA